MSDNNFDTELAVEITKAKENLVHYRDIVQGMVLPVKDDLDDYFNSRPAVERAYFYGLVKAINDLAKRLNARITLSLEASLFEWQEDNKAFDNYLKNLQIQLAKIGYGVDLSDNTNHID